MNLITVGYLDPEEVPRFREMRALRALAEKGHPGLSVARAVSAIVEHDAFMEELLERFELEEDAMLYINSRTGRIVERS